MAWHIAIYTLLVHAALASLLLLALATAAVLLTAQPARRIRIIELTLAGLLVLPLVALVPGVPRWSILPSTLGQLKMGLPSESIGVSSAKGNGPEVPVPIFQDPGSEPKPALIREVEPVLVIEAEPAPEPIAAFDQQAEPFAPEMISDLPAAADEPIAPESEVRPLAIEAADEPVREPAVAPIVTSSAVSEAQTTSRPAGWSKLWPELPSDFRFWIVAAYLTGVAAMMAWSLVGLLAVRRLLRSLRPADDACRAVLREIAGPASDRVALLVSPRASQPCALAWRPTTIVLPETMALGDDPQKLRWALAHEWSHVERLDIWSWTVSGVVRWFYFYQPLLWWLRRHLQLCQDFVADARAARLGAMAEDYAEFLTVVSSRFSHPPLAAGLGIGGRTSDLHRRVVMLVENHDSLETASPRKWNLVVLPIAVLVVVLLACAQGDQPASAAAESDTPTETQAERSQPVDTLEKAEAEKAVISVRERHMRELHAAEGKAYVEKAAVAAEKAAAEKAVVAAEAKTAAEKSAADAEKAAIAEAKTAVEKVTGPRKIGPGDVLIIDVIPNIETAVQGQVRVLLRPNLTVAVDPDGTLSLGSHYGRVTIQGKTLDEAEKIIQDVIASRLKNDANYRVVVGDTRGQGVETLTHELNVRVSYAAPAKASTAARISSDSYQAGPTVSPYLNLLPGTTTYTNNGPSANPYASSVVQPQLPSAPSRAGNGPAQAPPLLYFIQPLDTIEIRTTEKEDSNMAGVYLVEPEGDIRLPESYGRVQVKGLDVNEAGKAIRARIQRKLSLPPLHVTKRGRAVFPPGKSPGEGTTTHDVYRIRIGDRLTVCESQQGMDQAPDYEVQPDGSITTRFGDVTVVGMTLAEADKAISEQKQKLMPADRAIDFVVGPDYVTLGGWKEDIEEPKGTGQVGAYQQQQFPAVGSYAKPAPAPSNIPTRIKPRDILNIEVDGGYPDENNKNPRRVVVEADGNVALGVLYGRVNVGGKTLQEAEAAIEKQLAPILKSPKVQVTYAIAKSLDQALDNAGEAPIQGSDPFRKAKPAGPGRR